MARDAGRLDREEPAQGGGRDVVGERPPMQLGYRLFVRRSRMRGLSPPTTNDENQEGNEGERAPEPPVQSRGSVPVLVPPTTEVSPEEGGAGVCPRLPSTNSRNSLPTLKKGSRLAGTGTGLPVRGLRPS